MNIRQNCIFSFEDALKMQPKSRLEKIVNTLDLKPVLAQLNKPAEKKAGPKPYPAYAMLNALIAMRLENMNTFTQLVERLTHDPHLRYVCGFEPFGTAPSNPVSVGFMPSLLRAVAWKHYFLPWLYKPRKWAF